MKRLISFLFVISLVISTLDGFSQSEEICKSITTNIPIWLEAQKNDSVSCHFDKAVGEKIKSNDLGKMWGQLKAMNGAFKNSDGLKQFNNDGYLIYELNLFFEYSGIKMLVSYDKENKIAGIFFVPNRTEKSPIKLETGEFFTEKAIEVGYDKKKMAGILTIPKNATSFPIVILVHGSGQHDKNEKIGPNKPFKVIAHKLAEKNIASIRYDKRLDIPSDFDSTKQMEEMIVKDVLAAIELAKQTEGVDFNKIVIIGHSLGAMLAPMIAAKCQDVKAIVLCAGNARPLEDLILEQTTYLFSKDGFSKVEKKAIKKMKKQVANVKKINTAKSPEKLDFPMGLDYLFWKEISNYHQTEVAKNITQPMLILQGERDYQVTMTDFNLWQSQLNHKTNVYFKSFPKLNHLFCTGEGKSVPDEYFKTCDFDEEVISLISNWINSGFVVK